MEAVPMSEEAAAAVPVGVRLAEKPSPGTLPPGTKWCPKCHRVRPASTFRRVKRTKDGLYGWCRECVWTERKRISEEDSPRGEKHRLHLKWLHDRCVELKKDPEHPYAWTSREAAWRRHGIRCVPGCVANEGYFCRHHWQELWDRQQGLCALCQQPLERVAGRYPHVDHDRVSGRARGLLHQLCNQNDVGHFEALTRSEANTQQKPELLCASYLSSPPANGLGRETANGSPDDQAREWYYREKNWRRVLKIRCVPGCVANEGYFCRIHWQELWYLQGGLCGLCRQPLNGEKGDFPAVDHRQASGAPRGLVHKRCNQDRLGQYEALNRPAPESGQTRWDLCASYLSSPPGFALGGNAAASATPTTATSSPAATSSSQSLNLSSLAASSTEAARLELDSSLNGASAWLTWISSGAPGATGCAICSAGAPLEQHHVAGRTNSPLTVPLCIRCHRRASERQGGWDPRWVLEANPEPLKESLLVRGLSDLCEERGRFDPAAHQLAKRLRARYCLLAKRTVGKEVAA